MSCHRLHSVLSLRVALGEVVYIRSFSPADVPGFEDMDKFHEMGAAVRKNSRIMDIENNAKNQEIASKPL